MLLPKIYREFLQNFASPCPNNNSTCLLKIPLHEFAGKTNDESLFHALNSGKKGFSKVQDFPG